jgi:proteasome lid subunit RPN8/RPN11
MSDFLDLLNYLKIGRQSQLAQENEQFRYAEVFDENYNPNNIPVEIEVLKANLENNALYRNLETQFIGQSTVYASFIDNVRKYYFKRQSDGKYRDILEFDISSNWIVIPNDSAFIAIPLELDKQSYYYDHVLNKLIRLSLEGVTIIGDTFMYKPEDFEQFPAGEYTYNFKDNEGNKTNWKRWLAPHLISLSQNKREVVLSKASVRHKAYLLPLMSKQFFGGYSLKYYYKTNKVEPDMLQHDGYVAIKLNFNHITTCLSFLNETVFYQLDEPSSFNTKMRQEFLKCYRNIVIKRLEWIKNDNITEVLTFLYYIPDGVIKTLNKEFLWNVVSRALNQPLTNFGTDSEDIVLNLLILIAEMEGNADAFLKRLLKEPKEKDSIFRLLYKRMNGENFMRTIKLLRNIWLQSGYTDFENPEYEKTNNPKEPVSPAPIFLPYKSEKFIGFYSSNKNFDFSKDSYIEVTPDESWIDNIIGVIDPDLGKWVESKVEEQTVYHYHPYYPIILSDLDQEAAFDMPKLMPAFFLKANEDEAFWKNVITALEYTADVLSTVSGVGNIAKFRHLARVAEVASKAAKFDKARKYASLVSKIRLAVGVVEISSGTVNALIKLSGVDTPFSRALQKYLFYLELLSLGGEITLAIKNGLRNSAREALKHEKEILKSAKNADEANKIDEIISQLRKSADIAEGSGSLKYILKAKALDLFGAFKSLAKFEDEVRNLDHEVAKFFDDKGKVISENVTQGQKASVSIPDYVLDDAIRKAGGDSRKVILTHNHPTSSGISAEDIRYVFMKQLGGIRAVTREGHTYFLRKTGKLSVSEFHKVANDVYKKLKQKNEALFEKSIAKKTTDAENKHLAQLLTDGLTDELLSLKQIEYIKYE